MLFEQVPVIVRGGGDLASGVTYRLYRAGFRVIVTELATPVFVRRMVCYGEAVYSGVVIVDGLTARFVAEFKDVDQVLTDGEIAVVVDPEGAILSQRDTIVLVDARMAKSNLGTTIGDAPVVIGLGPGFVAGVDCHVVIETNRGHHLGRVIEQGAAEPDTSVPGSVMNLTDQRVLRAPVAGYVLAVVRIGDLVQKGQIVANVEDHEVRAPFDGVVRGLIHEHVPVTPGMKIGDIDPRAKSEHCFSISDKSLAVGGGVLEAVMAAPQVHRYVLSQVGNEAARGV